jgi:hypothetical protein
MSFEESTNKSIFFSFIPKRLEIKERPELNIFPFNVLFGRNKSKDGKMIMASALYEPDIMSFKKAGNEWSMNYHNVYGGNSWLSIVYDEVKNSYVGTKFINGESSGMAFGGQWDMFFIHFTMLSVAKGEMCKF